jgi:hypothetical protein
MNSNEFSLKQSGDKMDIKKIFALTVVLLALFCCISAASAGFFDFFGGGNTKAYTFDGFTLDIPESASVTYDNIAKNNSYGFTNVSIYSIKMEDGKTVNISSAKGEGVVSSLSEYIINMENSGAIKEETYNDWTVFNVQDASLMAGDSFVHCKYLMAKLSDGQLITVYGDDLSQLKDILNTYKDI